MEFLDTISQVKTNWDPYKKWEIGQRKKDEQNKKLREKNPPSQQEINHAQQYGKTLVNVINIMDQHSINKSEDASLVIGTYAKALMPLMFVAVPIFDFMLKKIPFVIKKQWGKYTPLVSIMLSGGIFTTTIQILKAKYEKQASRVARYETREKDLKDYRNFVIYNDEQIKQAEEIAKTLPEVKEDKKPPQKGYHPFDDYKNANITVKEMKKDYKGYEKWQKKYLKDEANKSEEFRLLNPPKEILDRAEKDRDTMFHTIKKVETNSLNYIGNMSMLFLGLDIVTLAAGTALGFGINKIIDKLQHKSILPKESKGLNVVKTLSFVALPVVLTIAVLSNVVKMKKDSARVGRYEAKKELLEHPDTFITYTKEQREKECPNVSVDETQKGFFARIKNDLKDLKRYKKDYAEYKNYMNTKYKEELKLHEALKQVEISDKQKVDAIELQKKAFHSFEKMDEKSQRFTDDTDAAVDIATHLTSGALTAALRITSVAILSSKLQKYNGGKLPDFKDILKVSKHLSGKELMVGLVPLVLPEVIAPLIGIVGIQVKKDAGKIGVMTAMNDLDDPKNFLDEKDKK